MTNAETLAVLFAPYKGKKFTAKEIQAVFADATGKSLNTSPSDFAGPNPRSGVVYSDQVFDRSGSDYVVRDAVIAKPKTGRSSQSLASALASFHAKVAPVAPVTTDVFADVPETVQA